MLKSYQYQSQLNNPRLVLLFEGFCLVSNFLDGKIQRRKTDKNSWWTLMWASSDY